MVRFIFEVSNFFEKGSKSGVKKWSKSQNPKNRKSAQKALFEFFVLKNLNLEKVLKHAIWAQKSKSQIFSKPLDRSYFEFLMSHYDPMGLFRMV
jgi:hypothetical protein